MLEHSATVTAQLGERSDELAVVTASLEQLDACEVRGHLAGVRAYLHDEVLAQAHAEELVLFPVLERLGGMTAASTLGVEHDTVRDASAALDRLADRPLDPAGVAALGGLLTGIETLLGGHLAHEADTLDALGRLEEDERERLLDLFTRTRGGRQRPPRPPWLPEALPRERTRGSADLLEPEAMVGASCPPPALAVVRSAVAASLDGADADTWREAVLAHSRYRLQVAHAEQCMRASGLWPWGSETGPSTDHRTHHHADHHADHQGEARHDPCS